MKLPDINKIKDRIGAQIRTFKIKFSKLDSREKNNFILIVSGGLIVLAIIIAIIGNVASKDKAPQVKETVAETNAPVNNDTTAPSVISSNGGIYKIITQNDPLTIRLSPDASTIAVGSLEKGSQVEILGVYTDDNGNKFGFVVAPDDASGWVNMQYTEYVSPATAPTTHGIGTYTVNSSTSDNALNMRRRPDDSNLGTPISNGTQVNVISVCQGKTCEWGLVEYNGEVGWLPFTALN